MLNKFNISIIKNKPNEINRILNKCERILTNNNSTIVLFGAGIIGLINLRYFKEYGMSDKIVFCDNDYTKQRTVIDDIPVISFDDLRTKYKDSYILITSGLYYDDIVLQLKENKLDKKIINLQQEQTIVSEIQFYEDYKNYYNVICDHEHRFSQLFDILYDDYSKNILHDRLNYCITANSKYLIPLKSKNVQYFDPDIVKLSKNEILIDGGAFTGDTVETFIQQTDGEFLKIYSFEPEKDKHSEFINKFSMYHNIELIPCGLWRKNSVLKFKAENAGTSKLSEYGNIEVPVTSIDEFLNGKPATLIKMDIEGAELDALRGAEKTIKKYRPKLAICVYHNPLDIVNIPLYIKELVPEYKIFLRHYNKSSSETVCYAIFND